jgi:structural maintenance of chromosome 2
LGRADNLFASQADIVKQKTQVEKLEAAVDNLRNEVLTDDLELGAFFLSLLLPFLLQPDCSPLSTDQMQKDIASAGVELAEARTQIDKIRKSLGTGQTVLDERASELQAVQRLIDEETKKLKGFTDELDSLKEEINGRKSAIVEVDLEIGKMEKEVEKAKKDEKDAREKVAKREKEFDWIADECQCVFDFPRLDPSLLSLTILVRSSPPRYAEPSVRRTRRTASPVLTCGARRRSADNLRRTTAR